MMMIKKLHHLYFILENNVFIIIESLKTLIMRDYFNAIIILRIHLIQLVFTYKCPAKRWRSFKLVHPFN